MGQAACSRAPPSGDGPEASAPCTDLGGVFFEPGAPVATETWQYVGKGQGGYSKVQSYNFVGDGHGSFDKDAVQSGPSVFRIVFVGVLVAAFVLAVFCFVAPVTPVKKQLDHGVSSLASWLGHSNSTRPAPSAQPSEEYRRGYHCSADRQEAKLAGVIFAVWTAMDANHDGRVSRAELAAQQIVSENTTKLLLFADDDLDGSLSQEEFTAALVPSEEMSEKAESNVTGANVSFDSDVRTWSDDKRRWCCDRAGIGCTDGIGSGVLSGPVAKTTEAPRADYHALAYDCKAEGEIWERAWSVAKQAWCCAHSRKGCPSGPSQAPGCDVPCEMESSVTSCDHRLGLARGAADSGACSKAMREVVSRCPQCASCQKSGAQCAASYNCSGATTAWSESQRRWCCSDKQRGCPPAATQKTCASAGCHVLADAQASCQCNRECEGKGDCCSDYKRVCVETTTLVLTAEASSCKTIGCGPTAGTGASCQCHASCNETGTCCADFVAVCKTTPAAHAGETPDCSKDADRWQYSWSPQKQEWCCAHGGAGCKSSAELPAQLHSDFHCDVGFATWTWGWSKAKKEWCCADQGRGCEGKVADPAAAGPVAVDAPVSAPSAVP